MNSTNWGELTHLLSGMIQKVGGHKKHAKTELPLPLDLVENPVFFVSRPGDPNKAEGSESSMTVLNQREDGI